MTIKTQSRMTIADSVDAVWAYICDVRRWPEWAPTVVDCRVRDAGPLRSGARLDQRAKAILGFTHRRSQSVTEADEPGRVAFAGPMGTSSARWGMQLDPLEGNRTDALMWIEVDLGGIMRAIPERLLGNRIQRVSDLEMVAIRAAVESDARAHASTDRSAVQPRRLRDGGAG